MLQRGRLIGRIARTESDPDVPRTQQRGRNYDWKCVEGPQEFRGNLFRYTDIATGGFPSGTVFQHIEEPKKFYTV